MTIEIATRTGKLTLVARPEETWCDVLIRGYSDHRGEPYLIAWFSPCGPEVYSVTLRKERASVSAVGPPVLVQVHLAD